MDPEKVQLIERFLDDDLDLEGAEALLRVIREDETVAQELAEALRMRGLMTTVLEPDTRGAELARIVSVAVGSGRGPEGFKTRVMERVKGRGAASLGEANKKSSRRRLRLRSDRRGGPWFLGLLAAGLLLGILSVLAVWPTNAGTPGRAARAGRSWGETDPRAKVGTVAESQERARQGQVRSPVEPRRAEAERQLQEIEREAVERQKKEALDQTREAKSKLESEAARSEQELREAKTLAEKAGNRSEEKPQVPQSLPTTKPQAKTEAAIAQLEKLEGEAFLVTREGKSPLKQGADLMSAQGLETGTIASRLVLRFPDKTQVELGPDTAVSDVKVESGKRLFVAKGTIKAEVSKQPKDQPMILATPHGEAKVLGTTLRIVVDPDLKKGMRLDVEEGKVELKNLAGKTVEVPSGHYAVAAAGVELASKLQEPPALALLEKSGEVTISFGPADRKLPQGVVIDTGEQFDPKRGYGWQGPTLVKAPGKNEMVPRLRATLDTGRDETDLRASRVSAGGENFTETWRMKIPNGRYLVTVSVGRYIALSFHDVQIQGTQVIDGVLTKAAEFLERKDIPVVVTGGELRMVAGGHRFPNVTEPVSNTALNYIVIRKAQR